MLSQKNSRTLSEDERLTHLKFELERLCTKRKTEKGSVVWSAEKPSTMEGLTRSFAMTGAKTVGTTGKTEII